MDFLKKSNKLTVEEKDFINHFINVEIDEFLNKMKKKEFAKDNFIMNPLDKKFKYSSSLARSFDSTLGNTFQKIATHLASFFYGKDYVFPPKAGADLVILNNNICYVIEIKLGGNLDSKKLPKEFSTLREYYDKKRSELPWEKSKINFNPNTLFNFNDNPQIENLKKIKPHYCLATVYIEDDVKNKLESFHFNENEFLLLEKDFWNFICNNKKDGFDYIKETYFKATFKINNYLKNLDF